MLKTHPSGKVALNKQGKSSEVKLNMEKQGADLAQKRALEKQKEGSGSRQVYNYR